MPGDLTIQAHRVIDVFEGLNSVSLAAKVIGNEIKALGPFSRPSHLCSLQLFDRFAVTLALFV
ncbi:MAG: hypothetical protein AB2556_23530 [Candidatus Thiodiazotropha sp.]